MHPSNYCHYHYYEGKVAIAIYDSVHLCNNIFMTQASDEMRKGGREVREIKKERESER